MLECGYTSKTILSEKPVTKRHVFMIPLPFFRRHLDLIFYGKGPAWANAYVQNVHRWLARDPGEDPGKGEWDCLRSIEFREFPSRLNA